MKISNSVLVLPFPYITTPPILMINYYSNIQMKFGEEEVEHVEKTTTTQKSLLSNQSNKAFYDEHDERGVVLLKSHWAKIHKI